MRERAPSILSTSRSLSLPSNCTVLCLHSLAHRFTNKYKFHGELSLPRLFLLPWKALIATFSSSTFGISFTLLVALNFVRKLYKEKKIVLVSRETKRHKGMTFLIFFIKTQCSMTWMIKGFRV